MVLIKPDKFLVTLIDAPAWLWEKTCNQRCSKVFIERSRLVFAQAAT